jgi:hypothetical protein
MERCRYGERDLWGFEDCRLSAPCARKEDRARFCWIGRSKDPSFGAEGIRFGMLRALVCGARSIIEQSASTLASGQRRGWAALRRGGRLDLDHDVSILIWLCEAGG